MNSRQLLASLARKTLVFIALMFLLSLIVFYVSRLTPGDPLQSFYGDAMQSMTTTELDAARDRNKLLDEIRRDYVLLARAKGLGRTRVLLSHCLRNVLPTIVSIMAISIPHVLSGTYVAESVFNYPGIGLLAVSSAKYHDYNLLMLMVLITGAMVMLSSLVAQAVNEVIDPRMKPSDGVVC